MADADTGKELITEPAIRTSVPIHSASTVLLLLLFGHLPLLNGHLSRLCGYLHLRCSPDICR